MFKQYALFYIPYLYTGKTRLIKKGRLLSFFIILIIPPVYIALLHTGDILNKAFLLKVLFGLIIVQNLYEIGYIQNDTETIKKEDKPTLRLTSDQLNYYAKKSSYIYIWRFSLSIILSLILFYFYTFNTSSICFVIVAHLLIPIYFVYNNIRNNWNLVLHFVLVIIKFTAIQFLFIEHFNLNIFLISILTFPLINLVERAANERFFPNFAKKYNITKGRVIYYSTMTVLFMSLLYFNLISLPLIFVFLYYLIYRTLILLKENIF